jgi:hypothetical protein
MRNITKEDVPFILVPLLMIAIFLVGEIWVEYRLSTEQYGFVFVLCVFFAATFVAIFRYSKNQGRVTFETFAGLGVVSILFAGYALFSVAAGFCGDISWLDFLLFKVWKPVFCSSVLAVSYGIAASAVVLAMWNGITLLYCLTRKLGNDDSK